MLYKNWGHDVDPNYPIIDELLYQNGYSAPYIRCVASPDNDRILRALHEEYATCHEGARSIVGKALRWGYYWSTMLKQTTKLVHTRESCQKYSPPHQIGQPPTELVPIPGAWSFAQWGINLIGPLPRSTVHQKWIIVVIEYFSKWVGTNALASTTEFQVIKFLK